MRDNQSGGNAAEVKPLAPGENGGQNLLRFGGGEHELGMLGRFFESLEKRIERFLGEHVNFVNDVNLEFGTGWGITDGVPQSANLIDAAVAGGVDFQHV